MIGLNNSTNTKNMYIHFQTENYFDQRLWSKATIQYIILSKNDFILQELSLYTGIPIISWLDINIPQPSTKQKLEAT